MIWPVIRFSIAILLCSCSSFSQNTLQENKLSYNYKDKLGSYRLHRENRIKNGQAILRQKLTPQMKKSLTLEKTIVVSRMGTMGKSKIPSLRPVVSQHTIWLEKKKYFTQLKVDFKNKSLNVIMRSPEAKWNGQKNLAFPKASVFCFFSQLPECLKYHGLLNKKKDLKAFYIIWDSYPYQQEIFEGVGESAFQLASIQFSRVQRGMNIYSISLGNQIIFYHFNNENEFARMYWIAQGISLTK